MAYKRPVGDRVFNMMQNVSNEKNVDMNNYSEIPKDRESIHNALMVAGMTPGIGNIADITDATLYALEGEFGDAAWSAAAAIPVIGQMVSGKKALKVAKEAGEEMVTLYRGVEKWYSGRMVRKGNFIGSGKASKDDIFWTTKNLSEAKSYAGGKGFWADIEMTKWVEKKPSGIVLEFEVPKSYVKKMGRDSGGGLLINDVPNQATTFKGGLPKEFLKKVHK